MPAKKYFVVLSDADRKLLESLARAHHQEFVRTRSRVLLYLADGMPDAEVAELVPLSQTTVQRIRRQFAEGGYNRVLLDRRRSLRGQSLPGAPRRLTTEGEARLVELVQGEPPEGHTRWTLRLLADRLVSDGVVDHISPGTVRNALRRRGFELGWKDGDKVQDNNSTGGQRKAT